MNHNAVVPLSVAMGFAILTSVGCSSRTSQPSKTEDGLDKVSLMLNWYPEAEHGGFYAAREHGIFEKYGLSVEIVAGGPNAPVAQELVTGRVQFAVGNADDVLLFNQQSANVVALMAPIQDTPRCILVREDSGVMSLDGLAGLTLQANEGRPFVDYMRSEGLLDNVNVVPYSGTVTGLVTDKSVAIQAYSFSEPLVAQQEGVATRKLMLAQAGFNPYASCLIATRSYLDEQDDVAERMTKACIEGWQQYLQDAEKSNRAILADNQHGMTLEALEFGATDLRGLCLPGEMDIKQVGKMSARRWQELVKQFQDLDLVDKSMKAEDVFDASFITSTSADTSAETAAETVVE